MTQSTVEQSGPASIDDVMTNIEGVRDALNVRRVFGEPYEVDGTTVIPVARVSGGAGGGGGESQESDAPGSGFGGGFGMQARPVGVYEVRHGEVVWKPSVDVTQLARRGQALGGLAMLCITLLLLRRWR